MNDFWTSVAVLLGLALAFVLVPLVGQLFGLLFAARRRRAELDQNCINLALFEQKLADLDADLDAGKLARDQYAAARRDLERELLHDLAEEAPPLPHSSSDLSLFGALGLLLPVVALLFYWGIGNPAIVERLASASATGTPDAAGAAPLDELVARLAARLEQTPDDRDGWVMLGRTYFALGQPESAREAFARAHALAPDQVNVALAYAEAIAVNQGNRLEGEPAELIRAALKAEPDNPGARWLAAMLAFQRGQFNAAAVAWEKLLEQVDPQSEDADQLRDLIARARERAGLPAALARDTARTAGAPASAPAAPTETADTAEPVADGPAIRLVVRVALDAAFADQVPPETTVFVYAKAAAGPPMPLAARRLRVADLPATVTLDDSMGMAPGLSLATFPEVIVGARVSPSGQAMPMSGDLEGETGPISHRAATPVVVTIDRQR